MKTNLTTKLFLISVLFSVIKFNAQQIDFSFQNNNLSIEQRAEVLVSQMTIEEKIA